jgi:hypothetical protein
MIKLLKAIMIDTMKEKQSDGTLKWSWLRLCGLIWFWLGDIGSLAAYYFFDKPISGEICTLTVVILLGVVGGKATSSFTNTYNNIKLGIGGNQNGQ